MKFVIVLILEYLYWKQIWLRVWTVTKLYEFIVLEEIEYTVV